MRHCVAGNTATANGNNFDDDMQGGGALRATCDWGNDCFGSQATIVHAHFRVHL